MTFTAELKDIISYYGLPGRDAHKLELDLKDLFLTSTVKLFQHAKRQKTESIKYSDETFNRVCKAVETVFNLSHGEILMREKGANPILARQMAHYFMLQEGMSSLYVGEKFKMNHATVLHAVKVINGWLWQDRYIEEHREITRLILEDLFTDKSQVTDYEF
mgnify:CR=1 FL=1